MRPVSHRILWQWLAATTLVGLAIASTAYWVAGNLVLRTRLLRNAVSGAQLGFAFSGSISQLRLDYENAYSLMPGRVHVDGLTLRGRERDMKWFISLDHADVDISLAALLRRTFRATRVRASGLVVRARLRLTREEATPDVIASLPSIPGCTDPPLLDSDRLAPPPLTDAAYNLWSVDLEDVDVEHVREVWIHSGRAEGDTRVRGRWLFRPQRWIDVGPAVVDANGVEFSYEGRSLVRDLQGSIRATVHAFDIRKMKGLAVLDSVSFDGTQRGTVSMSNAIQLIAPVNGGAFKRGDGPFDATIAVDHGTLVAGTRIRTEAMGCAVDSGRLTVEALVRMELGVAGDGATAAARVSDLIISSANVEIARAASIVPQVTTHHLRLARAFDDARFILDINGATTSDIAAWKPLVSEALVARSGPVSADAHADGSLADRRGNAEMRLSALRLTLERGGDRLAADITATAQVTEVSVAQGWASGTATVAASHLAVRIGPAVVESTAVIHVALGRGTWGGGAWDLSGSSAVVRDAFARSAGTGKTFLVVPLVSVVAPRVSLGPSGANGHVALDIPVRTAPGPRRTARATPAGNRARHRGRHGPSHPAYRSGPGFPLSAGCSHTRCTGRPSSRGKHGTFWGSQSDRTGATRRRCCD